MLVSELWIMRMHSGLCRRVSWLDEVEIDGLQTIYRVSCRWVEFVVALCR